MRRFVSILLLITMAFASCSLSPALAESVTESELVGAWQFVGGGELMGFGFRLNADGTGQWLESEDMEHCPPKHLRDTGDSFTWQLDGDSFICRNSLGTVIRYTLEQADSRILFTEEEAGGFYARFDEEAIRAEIEDRMAHAGGAPEPPRCQRPGGLVLGGEERHRGSLAAGRG